MIVSNCILQHPRSKLIVYNGPLSSADNRRFIRASFLVNIDAEYRLITGDTFGIQGQYLDCKHIKQVNLGRL